MKYIYLFSLLCLFNFYNCEKEIPKKPLLPHQKTIPLGHTVDEILKTLSNCKTEEDLKRYFHFYSAKSIEKDFGVVQKRHWDKFDIKYLLHQDTIRFLEINRNRIDSLAIPLNKVISMDTTFMKTYLKQHNSFYKVSLSLQSMEKQLLRNKVLVLAMGNDGRGFTREILQIYDYAKQNQRESLHQYLKSCNIEEQAMGAMGLLAIKKSGYNLTKEEEDIIEHLLNRNSLIEGEIACVGGYFPTADVISGYSNPRLLELKEEEYRIVGE